jgi:hypothetical protein
VATSDSQILHRIPAALSKRDSVAHRSKAFDHTYKYTEKERRISILRGAKSEFEKCKGAGEGAFGLSKAE